MQFWMFLGFVHRRAEFVRVKGVILCALGFETQSIGFELRCDQSLATLILFEVERVIL